jgi:hypothetical protein
MEADKGISKKDRSLKLKISIFFLLILLCCSSCILVPFVESVSQMGVTEGDRTQLLNQEIKKFTDAWYWGNEPQAMKSVAPELQPLIKQEFREQERTKQRVVESKVLSADLDKEAREADVVVLVKAFQPSTLVVHEIEEKQHWMFNMSDGWKLQTRSVAPAK